MRISRETIEPVLAQMRAVQGKVTPNISDPASNGADDDMLDALNARGADTKLLSAMLNAMGRRELEEMVALSWIGRGDYEPAEWQSALAAVPGHVDDAPADYLLATPLAAEQVSDGLERMREHSDLEPGA